MTNLELDGVTKVFGDSREDGIVAVDDVSIEIADGEFLVLLGPSGCGKTTTLRMIGGLETPNEGEIKYDGTVVNDVKPRNRDVAMVFQDFALYPHMSVKQNLGFGLKREENDMSSEEVEQEVESTAEMLGIGDLLGSKPSQISGGQKQRVALGRAIIREPRLFLFDEPLANLDAKLRKTMRTEIDELQTRVGITSVYVTHNQEEAMTIADRIAILDQAQLQQVGTPTEVFNEPVNLFVAQFVGSPDINLFDGHLTPNEGGYHVKLDGLAFDIPENLVPRSLDETDVVVGFRPQDLYQAHGEMSGSAAVIESSVKVIEPLGTEAIIHAESGEDDITAKIDDFYRLTEGSEANFTINLEHVYLFDATTGELLKGRRLREAPEDDATDEVTA